jgi:tRNA pseudouridine55 synthase
VPWRQPFSSPIPPRPPDEMNGIISLDKPPRMTSHDVVAAVRHRVRDVKVGHAGTLDPNATGVLLLLLGKATKISRFLMGLEKEYVFTMNLGIETDTLDRWGRVVKTADPPVECREKIVNAAAGLTGWLDQVAPSVSALKHDGVPLYRLARQGGQVPRKVRKVEIKRLEILDIDYPLITARVVCSSGTYVRSLARDIGHELGTVATVFCLRRTRVGDFSIESAVPYDDILGGGRDITGVMVPLRRCLSHLPHLRLRQECVEGLRHGRQPRPEDLYASDREFEGQYAVLTDPEGEPVAIAARADGPCGFIRTERVM